MNCFYLNAVYNLETMNHIAKYHPHFEEFIKKLAELDKKMEELDASIKYIRIEIYDLIWQAVKAKKAKRQ